MCTYNGAAYLQKQLQSICSQTYKNIELVVVDDGSTDNTFTILSELTDKARIKVYRNEFNLGFIRNFEKAVSLCTGEFIALSDQDDIWLPEKIETLLRAIEDNILVYADAELIDHEDNSLHTFVSDVVNPVKTNNPLPLLFNNCAPGNSLFFRRELVGYALPFPEKIFHDWWLMYTAASIGRIAYVAAPLVKYRQHEANLTNMTHHRKNVPKEAKQQRAERMLYYLTQFQTFNRKHGIKNKILDRLIELLSHKSRRLLDINLFRFLYKHKDELYYVLKKSSFQKNHRIFKASLPD